jgi:hypothetical protein
VRMRGIVGSFGRYRVLPLGLPLGARAVCADVVGSSSNYNRAKVVYVNKGLRIVNSLVTYYI